MATVAVIGPRPRVRGWGLGGAIVLAADSEAEARAAWARLGSLDVAVVLLAPEAAEALRGVADQPGSDVLVAVIPA